jgi:hypothetical protein
MGQGKSRPDKGVTKGIVTGPLRQELRAKAECYAGADSLTVGVSLSSSQLWAYGKSESMAGASKRTSLP